MPPAVFLDRDNTIIHNSGDLADPDRVRLVQGAAMAIASLCGLGYKIVIVTNQGGVARGKYSEEAVQATNERVREMVMAAATGARIDGFYYCPYHPEGTVEKYKREHEDRKPRPGMLLRAAKDLKIDLAQSWMVGDGLRDIEAGRAAGVRTVLVRDPRLEHNPIEYGAEDQTVRPEFEADTLIEAVRMIASARKPEAAEVLGREQARGRRWDREAVAKVQRPRGEAGAGDASAEAEKAVPRKRSSGRAAARGRAGVVEASSVAGEEAAGDTAAAGEGGQGQADRAVRGQRAVTQGVEEGEAGEGVLFRPWDAPAGRSGPGLGERVKQAGKRVVDASKEAWERHQAERTQRLAEEAEGEELAEEAAMASSVDAQGAERAEAAEAHGGSERASAEGADSQSDGGVDAAAVEASAPQPRGIPGHEDATNTAAAGDDDTARLLRQVLRELRHQRLASAEFSTAGLIAAVLQVLAIVCLLGGLWMSGADGAVFMRWLGTAVMLQLATIAVLLFPK